MESLAQMGVQLLLFALGLEFSLSKLRAVRAVALLGEHPTKVLIEKRIPSRQKVQEVRIYRGHICNLDN